MPHNNSPERIDEIALQRLVDNELSYDQVRQLLAEVESGDDATKWKQIALAFTENQLFERAFCQQESASRTAAAATVLERPEQLVTSQSSSLRYGLWVAALAACLLWAVTMGYQFSDTSPNIGDDSVVHSPSTSESVEAVAESKPIEVFDRTTLASYEPDHRLKAAEVHSDSIGKHDSSIPLYDIGRLNPEQLANLRGEDRAAREALFSEVLPQTFSPELVQQVQQSGGMVDQNLEFISGRLDDGRSWLVPYRTIRFLPGQ